MPRFESSTSFDPLSTIVLPSRRVRRAPSEPFRSIMRMSPNSMWRRRRLLRPSSSSVVKSSSTSQQTQPVKVSSLRVVSVPYSRSPKLDASPGGDALKSIRSTSSQSNSTSPFFASSMTIPRISSPMSVEPPENSSSSPDFKVRATSSSPITSREAMWPKQMPESDRSSSV